MADRFEVMWAPELGGDGVVRSFDTEDEMWAFIREGSKSNLRFHRMRVVTETANYSEWSRSGRKPQYDSDA